MILDKFRLDGKVALVTGASRGLGRAAALALAEAGAAVAVAARGETNLRAVAEEIQRIGRPARAVPCDVADAGQIAAMMQRVRDELGHIDVLVNAAGIIRRAPAEEYPIADWDPVMDVNLRGTFLCCQAVARVMLEQGDGGKTVNVASLLSALGGPLVPAYSARKGGVLSLTRALAVEWAQYGITVNAIGPGYFRTEMTEALQKDEARSRAIVNRTLLKRWGEPEELTGAVLFLVSPASDYVTGQVGDVDGGRVAG